MPSRFSRRARIASALAAMLAASVRCGGGVDLEPLQRFDTCPALELYLEDQILHPGVVADTGSSGLTGCTPAASSIQRPGAPPPPRFATTTTTDVAGVDEPDFVKNDGAFLYVLRRGEMKIAQAWPADELALVSSTPIEGAPFSLFVDGDRALVLSRPLTQRAQTIVTLLDLGVDRRSPKEVRATTIDGDFVDARAKDGQILVVTRAIVAKDVSIDTSPFADENANRAKLREAGIGGLLPSVTDFVVGKDASPRTDAAVACENTFAPTKSDGHSMLLVLAFDLRDPSSSLRATGVVSGFAHVHATDDALVLAATETHDGGYFTPPFATTRIHVLDSFAGKGAAQYRATGIVDGTILDDTAISEGKDGTLRVVVTDNTETTDGSNPTTSLVVFERSGTRLDEIGRAVDVARGQSVESVKFVGDKAYVVTVPAADAGVARDLGGIPVVPISNPLTVVDVSDAHAPQVRGTLDVGSYTALLESVDDTHLVAVGVDAEHGPISLSLSLFDVSDDAKPQLVERTLFGDDNAGSDALVDRHAFTYFAEERALAIPFQRFDANTHALLSSTIAVFHVDARSIDLLGEVEQRLLFAHLDGVSPENGPCSSVRRSVMMSDGPDAFVYAISTAGISAAKLAPGVDPVATLALARNGDEACDANGGPL